MRFLLISLFNLFFPPEEGEKEPTNQQLALFGGIIVFLIGIFIAFNL